MTGHEKELSEIKGYVARLYQMVRGRTQMALELTEDQAASTLEVGETIEEINTNLQIANSFQQEEIYNKLTDVEKLLQKILNVEPEKFTKVDKWMGMSFGGTVYFSALAFVIEESEKNYHIKEAWNIPIWRGPGWVKRGWEPLLMAADKDTIATIDKNKVLAIYEPTRDILTEFLHSDAYESNYNFVVDPWKKSKRPLADMHRAVERNFKEKED